MKKALIILAVLGMAMPAMAAPMEGGPYTPSTEPYVACSQDGFSGVQGQNGWYYGYIPHGSTWNSNILASVTLFDKFDPGQGPSGTWSVQNPSGNQNLLRIDALGQTKAGGGDAYLTIRYWVANTTVSAADVLGGYYQSSHSSNDPRLIVKIQSGNVTTGVADNWQATNGMQYFFANQQINPGDVVLFGVGHSGTDQASDGYIQSWHQHITPEPASALLMLLGLPLLRRKTR